MLVMLRARIFTAVIVLCLFLAALLYLPAIFWMVLLLALTVTGSWEWSRLAKFSVTSFHHLSVAYSNAGWGIAVRIEPGGCGRSVYHIVSEVLCRIADILDADRSAIC